MSNDSPLTVADYVYLYFLQIKEAHMIEAIPSSGSDRVKISVERLSVLPSPPVRRPRPHASCPRREQRYFAWFVATKRSLFWEDSDNCSPGQDVHSLGERHRDF